MAIRDAQSRLADATADVDYRDARARLTALQADQARCRVDLLRARIRRDNGRRKIVLGVQIRQRLNQAAYDRLISDLWQVLSETDLALVLSPPADDEPIRRDTRRNALLGHGLIQLARQANPADPNGYARLITLLIENLSRPHDVRVFDGWSWEAVDDR